MKLQASDDMRTPLAFLLGKLNFEKEFRNVKATPEGPDQRIGAEPKSDNLPYSNVEFVVAPDQHIEMVKVIALIGQLSNFASIRKKWTPRWTISCSNSSFPRVRNWWRPPSSHG